MKIWCFNLCRNSYGSHRCQKNIIAAIIWQKKSWLNLQNVKYCRNMFPYFLTFLFGDCETEAFILISTPFNLPFSWLFGEFHNFLTHIKIYWLFPDFLRFSFFPDYFLTCGNPAFVQAQIKENIKLRVTGFCEGNSPVTSEFPAQRASNAENVSIWLRHHVLLMRGSYIYIENHYTGKMASFLMKWSPEAWTRWPLFCKWDFQLHFFLHWVGINQPETKWTPFCKHHFQIHFL